MTEKLRTNFFADILEIKKVDEKRWVEWKVRDNLSLGEALGCLNFELKGLENQGKTIFFPQDQVKINEQCIEMFMIDTLNFFKDFDSSQLPITSLPITLNKISSNRGHGRGAPTNLYVRTHIANFVFDTDPSTFTNLIDFKRAGAITDRVGYKFPSNPEDKIPIVPRFSDVLVDRVRIFAKTDLSSSISELIADTLWGKFDSLKIQQSTESYLKEELKHLPQVE